jgi:hypothetical protein
VALTKEQREEYFNENGCYPIEDSDVPANEKIILTAEQIAEGESIRKKISAIQYLKETDWYATRKAETGKAIPDDILTKRAQARLDASD